MAFGQKRLCKATVFSIFLFTKACFSEKVLKNKCIFFLKKYSGSSKPLTEEQINKDSCFSKPFAQKKPSTKGKQKRTVALMSHCVELFQSCVELFQSFEKFEYTRILQSVHEKCMISPKIVHEGH